MWDGMGWDLLDGMVIIGCRQSKSTFDANKKTCKDNMPFVVVHTQFPNTFSESLKMSKKVIGVVAATIGALVVAVLVGVLTVGVVTAAAIINIEESGQYLNNDVRNGSSPTSSTMINEAESTTTTRSNTTTTTSTIKTSK